MRISRKVVFYPYTVHKNFQKATEAAKLNYTTDRRKEAAKKDWEKRRANVAVVKSNT